MEEKPSKRPVGRPKGSKKVKLKGLTMEESFRNSFLEDRKRMESMLEWNRLNATIQDLSDQGKDALAFTMVDGSVHVSESECTNKFSRYLKAATGRDLRETILHLNNLPEYHFTPPTSAQFESMTIQQKLNILEGFLLVVYQRTASDYSASKIPWSRVKILGWPSDVRVGLEFHSSSNLDKIFRALEIRSIVFHKI